MADDSGSVPEAELTLVPVTTGARTRRRALWSVLAVAAVAAGALTVTSGGGDGGPPRLPVALGAAGNREMAAGAADMSMAAWVTYVAGEGLPALGGDGAAYRLGGDVDESRVRALADALGVSGEPTVDAGLWHLESDGAVLEVYEDGGGTWWYAAQQYVDDGAAGSGTSSGSAGCQPGPAVDCGFTEVGVDVAPTTVPAACAKGAAGCPTRSDAVECPPNADCIDPSPLIGEPCAPDAICTLPAPAEPLRPADLPSKDEARRIALDLLAATGMDVEDAKVTIDGPYDAWYVTVEPLLDGVPVTGWLSTAGVGSKGVITSATGTLATPERLGHYPLIDTRAAIDRLNAQQGGFGGGGGVMPLEAETSAVARDTTAEAPEPTDPCPEPDSDDPSAPTCAQLAHPDPTTTIVQQCKVRPDGAEICESVGSGGASSGMACASVGNAPAGGDVTVATISDPSCGEPVPYEEPGPIEVVLTDAERVLVLMGAIDETGDAYLLPGYRFDSADGGLVEVAAVADESLASTTTVPDADTTLAPEPAPAPCNLLVEDDGSGTTHTVGPCPAPSGDPTVLEPGQTPVVGVGYAVEVIGHCVVIVDFGGRYWTGDDGDGDIQEYRGTFTLTSADEGTFSTASGYRLQFQAQGPSEDYPGCD